MQKTIQVDTWSFAKTVTQNIFISNGKYLELIAHTLGHCNPSFRITT